MNRIASHHSARAIVRRSCHQHPAPSASPTSPNNQKQQRTTPALQCQGLPPRASNHRGVSPPLQAWRCFLLSRTYRTEQMTNAPSRTKPAHRKTQSQPRWQVDKTTASEIHVSLRVRISNVCIVRQQAARQHNKISPWFDPTNCPQAIPSVIQQPL